MGKYFVYIFSAYSLVILVLITNILAVFLKQKKIIKQLKQSIKI